MKWDSEADQHLLLAILSAHKVTVDYSRVAPFIGCTPRACEERIKKLRKQAKECGYDFTSGSAFSDGLGKGRKKRQGTAGGAFPPAKRGWGKVYSGSVKGKGVEDGDDDDDEEEDRKVSVAELEAAIESGGGAAGGGGGEMKIKREPGYLSTPSFDEASSDQDDNNSGGGGEEESKPAVKRRKPIAVRIFEGDSSNASFASTASGVRIPLDVPLEVATGPLDILGYSAGGGLRRGFGIESTGSHAGFTVVGNGDETEADS